VNAAYAQDSGAPAFEVASVKPSGPTDPKRDRLFEMAAGDGGMMRGGHFLPGDGQRIEIHGMSAAELIAAAYRIPLREIVGPSWMSDARFEVEALIPSGQTRDEAPAMLLTLLQERLALKAHHEVRKTSGYILSVGKGGPKLKEAAPFTPTREPGSSIDRPNPPFIGHTERLNHCDMAQLADDLAQNLQAPVEDRTGLKGFYSILIQIPKADMSDEAERPAAFREALSAYGLHLATGKIDASILVIDNISKMPTPN